MGFRVELLGFAFIFSALRILKIRVLRMRIQASGQLRVCSGYCETVASSARCPHCIAKPQTLNPKS